MDLHARQQFDFLLHAAIERFVERVEQRSGGPMPALERLRRDPNAEGIHLDDFVSALFGDFLLDNIAGAAFVLQALGKRPVPTTVSPPGETIEQHLGALARAAFAVVLRGKTEEALEQRDAFHVTE